MSLPTREYVAVAGQQEFDTPSLFISRDHIKVRVNGAPMPILEWTGPNRVRLPVPLRGGELVEVQRETPIDQQLVTFQDGAVLTQEDLNTAVRQLLYKQQELIGLYESSLRRSIVRIGTANGVVSSTPEDLVQELANLVLEEEVLDNFRQRIADIDLNADAIVQQGLTLGGRLDELRTDHDALADVVNALTDLGDGQGIEALIQQERDARIVGDAALAATIGLIGAKSNDNNAFILDLNRVRVSPTESLALRFNALQAADSNNQALIQQESQARSTAISAEATARQSLATTLRGEFNAAIVAEQTARSNGLTAEANARTSLAATLRGEISAAVQTETNARVSQDNVFANNFALLGARNGAGTAWVLNESTVQLSNGTALGTRLSGIDVSIGNVSSSVVNEQNARIQGDNNLANSISVVNTTVGNLSSSVSTLSQSVNGVLARYGVSLDVNGYVTGFVQNNNGSFGSFDILADRFRVVVPGQVPRTVFEVDANGVALNGNVRVNGNLLIGGTVTTPALQQGSISNSGYWQTTFGGFMSNFPFNVWVDFNTGTGGGSGGGGGGSGGGGGGGTALP